jgi:hypothetical protein
MTKIYFLELVNHQRIFLAAFIGVEPHDRSQIAQLYHYLSDFFNAARS